MCAQTPALTALTATAPTALSASSTPTALSASPSHSTSSPPSPSLAALGSGLCHCPRLAALGSGFQVFKKYLYRGFQRVPKPPPPSPPSRPHRPHRPHRPQRFVHPHRPQRFATLRRHHRRSEKVLQPANVPSMPMQCPEAEHCVGPNTSPHHAELELELPQLLSADLTCT